MSTRSRIGVEDGNGCVQSIYCHWDGHPETVGLILARGYRTRGAAEALIMLGDLSQLGEDIRSCDAYHRDWGRAWEASGPESHRDAESYRREGRDDGWIRYLYLFRDGGWRVADRNGQWRPLPRFAPDEGEE